VCIQDFMRHGTLLSEVAQAGVPLMIEKPLAASPEQGERVRAALQQAGTWLMVGYHKRSDPATMWAKAEIERLKQTGELGRMTYLRIAMPPGNWIAGGFNELITSDEALPAMESDPWPDYMSEAEFNQYVAFVNYYIHQVNLLRHLLGEGYEVTHADPAGVLLVARSDSGLPGLIEMEPYRTTRDWQEVALVCFEQGYVRIELPGPVSLNVSGKVTVFRDPEGGEPDTLVPVMPPQCAMRQQAVNFLAAVRGEMDVMCLAEEALEDLRVARQYMSCLHETGGTKP